MSVIVFGRAGEVTYANARKEAKQRDAAAVPTTDTTDVTDSRHNTTHGRSGEKRSRRTKRMQAWPVTFRENASTPLLNSRGSAAGSVQLDSSQPDSKIINAQKSDKSARKLLCATYVGGARCFFAATIT